ncbi:MAG: hypothetical protein RJB38_1936 [Pseudomonadota bacterium]|jgi:small-conductance mechanosensitive channel
MSLMPEGLQNFSQLGAFVVAAVVAALLVFVSRHLLRQTRRALESRGAFQFMGLLEALKGPISVLSILLGCLVFLAFLPDEFARLGVFRTGLKVAMIAALTWTAERLMTGLLRAVRLPHGVSEGSRSFFVMLARVAAFLTGGAVILDAFGISITPLLASLGVGSLAVALALQDTLGNFFSGLYLQFDRPIRLGDFVRLESGAEGYVIRIGWRSSAIRLLSNNVLVIPNSKLSASILTNYELPQPETWISVEWSVPRASDLEKVEALTLEVASEVLRRVPGGVSGALPEIRFHSLSDLHVHFTVVLKARHWVEQYSLKHELIKGLHRAYRSL